MKLNVLIVEDDAIMRVILKKTVLSMDLDTGIEVGAIYEAENGKKGLEALEQHEIDLMLVDIYMPVMDGMDMLDHVYDHPEFSEIPAVVVSAENDEDHIDAILRKGLGFVPKPLTHELLEDKVRKMLKKSEV